MDENESRPADPAVESVIEFEEQVVTDVRKRTSLYEEIRQLSRPQRIILAVKGGMEARLILLKLYDPMIYFYLCKNPKITPEEVVEIAKSDLMTPNTAELIARNKEWLKNERIKFHLVMNRKTPQGLALHIMSILGVRSLKEIAKTAGAPPIFRRLALKRLQGIKEE